MKIFKTVMLAGLMVGSFACEVQAQEDEIIVTAMRRAASPGILLEKKGDFLLLQVQIENDSRGLDIRLSEISDTVDNIISAAKSDPSIELSIIGENDLVRPLSMESFQSGIRGGNRPDTSVAYMKVKTKIPEQVEDSYKLATKLGEFVESIEEVGRTRVKSSNEVSVSVVNPYQYRKEVQKMVLDEINEVTSALGPDYRVVLSGIDGEVQWARSGDLNLAFYLPYEYFILPTSLNTIMAEDLY